MAMTRPWAIVVGVTTLLAIGTATTLNAQSGFQEAFRDGMAAFEQRRWAAAVAQFQRAAQLKPESGETVRLYGTRFEMAGPAGRGRGGDSMTTSGFGPRTRARRGQEHSGAARDLDLLNLDCRGMRVRHREL